MSEHESGKRSTLVRLRRQDPAVGRGFSGGVDGRCSTSPGRATCRAYISHSRPRHVSEAESLTSLERERERQNPRRYTGFALVWRSPSSLHGDCQFLRQKQQGHITAPGSSISPRLHNLFAAILLLATHRYIYTPFPPHSHSHPNSSTCPVHPSPSQVSETSFQVSTHPIPSPQPPHRGMPDLEMSIHGNPKHSASLSTSTQVSHPTSALPPPNTHTAPATLLSLP